MTTNPLEELNEQMTLHEVDQIIKALEPSLKRRGWTPPDITELMEEAQQCYSITGLKEFIAKHHPDYVLECRTHLPDTAAELEALKHDNSRLMDSLNSAEAEVDRLTERERGMRQQIKRLEDRDWLFVEAMSEIKATVDGNSNQPVADIIAGLIEELKPLKEQSDE